MATTISLGDPASSFKVFAPGGQVQYEHVQTKFYTEERTITGALDRLEANIFENRYSLVLTCASADVTNLRTLYALTNSSASTNRIRFTDLQNITWSPSTTGGTGIVTNTGVYFDGDLKIKPQLSLGWANSKFLVAVELVVVATGLSAS